MARVRTTLTVDENVLRAVKVRAARTGKGDSQVIEDALRRELGFDLLAGEEVDRRRHGKPAHDALDPRHERAFGAEVLDHRPSLGWPRDGAVEAQHEMRKTALD